MSNYRKQPIPKSIRLEVFRRDNYTCRYCGEKARSPHADHVYPESRGGVTSVDNLVTSCKACNVKKYNRVGIWPLPLSNERYERLERDYFEVSAKYDGVSTELINAYKARDAILAAKDKEIENLDKSFVFRLFVFTVLLMSLLFSLVSCYG